MRGQVLAGDLGGVLDRIVHEVGSSGAGIVIVDSFRTMVRSVEGAGFGRSQLQSFIQRFALHLTGWQAMTFLVGDDTDPQIHDSPVFTVADATPWLRQDVERSVVVHRLLDRLVELRYALRTKDRYRPAGRPPE